MTRDDRRAGRTAGFVTVAGKFLIVGALVVAAPGCGIFGGGKTPPPELTSPRAVPTGETKTIHLSAGKDLNNCGDGPANALGVRVYQLSGDAALGGAPQAALWEDDEAELGKELLDRQEFFLDPGQVQAVEVNLAGTTRFVAVVGNYCKTREGCWRWIVAVDKFKDGTTLKLGPTCLVAER